MKLKCRYSITASLFLTATALLFSCASGGKTVTVPQALENFIVKHTARILPLSQVKTLKAADLGIQGSSRKIFITVYGGFLQEYKKIIGQYRENPSLTRFAAIRFRDAVLEKKVPLAQTMANRPDNSLYVAFALLTGAGIDYEAIGDRQHLLGLARAYGISLEEIENGLWETLTRDWDEILMSVVAMIRSNMETMLSGDRAAFVANVMQPYLVLLSKDRIVPDDVETLVFESFDALFPSERKGGRPLQTYVKAFKRGRTGGAPLTEAEDLAFNRHLKRFGFMVDLEPDVCCWYQLLGTTIPVNTAGVGDVLVRKRTGVVLHVEGEEQSAYEGNDIALTYEYFNAVADEIAAVCASDSVGNFYTSDDNALWNSIGCRMRAARADTLFQQSMRKAFPGRNRQQIFTVLIREAAARELKRKWDGYVEPKVNWFNIDADVSAYLAAAICGGNPLDGLFNYINRIQWYYRGVGDSHVRSRLQPLIIEGWKIVEGVAEGKVDDAGVRQRLQAVYSNYVTLKDRKLPPLEPFEEKVVRGALAKVPEFAR